MCKHYNISRQLFHYRLSHGYSLQDTLIAPKTSRQKVYDHTGKLFNTISQMCEYWEISECTYRKWINAGYTKESVLTKAYKQEKYIGKSCKDHLGNNYKSITSMCNYYGITIETYLKRIKRGYTKEEALLGKVKKFNYLCF